MGPPSGARSKRAAPAPCRLVPHTRRSTALSTRATCAREIPPADRNAQDSRSDTFPSLPRGISALEDARALQARMWHGIQLERGSQGVTPPRVPRWLLERTLPPEDRGVILGDLAEEFETRKGAGAWARWWYCRQAIRAIPGGIWRRRPRFRNVVNDLRFTCRLWRRHPAFAVAAISTQAIGIAVTTAVLVVAYAVLFRPLPYADSERLRPSIRRHGTQRSVFLQGFSRRPRCEPRVRKGCGIFGREPHVDGARARLPSECRWRRSPTVSSNCSA